MNICISLCTFLVAVSFVIYAIDVQDEKKDMEVLVENWAEAFGNELWYLGQNITKADEIRQRYTELNETHVFRTNASQLLQNISVAMNRMIRLKMTAVSCLMDAAERLSEEFEWKFYGEHGISNYTYYNAKYSPVEGIDDSNDEDRTTPNISLDLGKIIIQLEFKTMNLTKNDHFYGLSVNTDYSAVYLPTILFEKLEYVQRPLQWSEKLDQVFLENYRSDPSLSWQYFGSTAGFMRHYPAYRWSAKPNVFDSRLRPWYIQAATCSKDVVILSDISGSMYGMHQSISHLVMRSLLMTFNNDDSINIIFFNTTTFYLVPCFKELLVQATPENINTFHKAINDNSQAWSPQGSSNYSKAFIEAFQLLASNRNNKKCSEETCNQMIMLITDDDPNKELFDVVKKYNRIEGNTITNIPVRIFTYMIGRDITTTPELERLACENRGSFAHVHSKDEVLESILKYIAILARPLVLQAEKHPVTWSHSFMDISDQYVTNALQSAMDFDKQKNDLAAALNEQLQFPNQHKMDSKYLKLSSESKDENGKYQKYRPMTAISIPIFNKKRDEFNKTKGDLLGVAGTDVPISEFEKLTLPYKIGVNGYAFIVTNNGYLLFHPNLRPVEDQSLKDNYNSIDLTELELLDDDKEEPRQPNPKIVQLREEIVNHKHGSMENLSIKFHYDDMRRVGSEVRNYHYSALDPKIEGPFTLGLVLPASYGNNWIKAGDEINKSIKINESYDKYFQDQWKIHPDWVYCDYFHSSEKKFETPESKLLHFMEKIFSPDWEWREQYSDLNISMDEFNRSECDRKPIDKDEFFCDKELMQLLFFDAKITHALYNKTWNPTSEFEKHYVNKYNVSVRFLATQGGLSRWQHLHKMAEGELEFGDVHKNSVEEVWYKRPVLYHNLNSQAFVFSVPFNSGDNDKLKITASHAIFVEDDNTKDKAPGSVVGYEMLHQQFYKRFMDITKSNENCTNSDCVPCTSDHVDCYIIDENGYVVLSEIPGDTGRFFAQTELKSTGVIMETMISKKIFRRIPMFDYQALCKEIVPNTSASSYLLTPFYIVYTSLKMFLMNLVWLLIEGNFGHVWSINEGNTDDVTVNKNTMTINSACDKKADLFMLQHEHLTSEGFDAPPSAGSTIRPFFVKRIAHSNLLLVVVKNAESSQSNLSVNSVKVDYKNIPITNADHSCNKLNLNSFYRRKLGGCYNSHPEEPFTKVCSKCHHVKATIVLMFVMSILCIQIS